jgi:glucose/arabinose dehydrogenase
MPRVSPPVLIALVPLALVLLVSCGNHERSAAAPLVALEPGFGGREFERPIEVGAYPVDRMFVAEQEGLVWLLTADGGQISMLLDLRGLADATRGREGLLSVALDPQFASNHRLWAYYFARGEPRTVLARFEVVDDRADVSSQLVVLEVAQPGGNQNGGAIRFGPDGMLYLGLGDGSASFDPFENGQDRTTLLGSIVRLDVRSSSADEPYRVPPDNPFVHLDDAQPEIWAYGLRNPWRMSFDPERGELWGGDVMASGPEEINRYEAGGNFGWNEREGFDCLTFPPCAGEPEGLIPPMAVYDHGDARCAVVGGVVYRGDELRGLDGWFLAGDFCSGEVLAIDAVADHGAEAPPVPQTIAEGAGAISSFGLDQRGEVYITSYDGVVWRVVSR